MAKIYNQYMKIKLQRIRAKGNNFVHNLRKKTCVSHEKYAKNVGFVFVKERNFCKGNFILKLHFQKGKV